MKPESISTTAGRVASSGRSTKRIRQQWCAYALAFAVMLTLALFANPSAQAQTFTVLHAFTGEDGELPLAGLVMDAKGNLYGTTYFGGAAGEGVVFKVDKTRRETVLHSFNFSTDGGAPEGSLVMDAKRNLYGTTAVGANPGGTVFKVNSKGKETVLYGFTDGTDGAVPRAGLVMDAKGNLYGTTTAGGEFGGGTIFEVNAKGKETVLYSFCSKTDCTDGAVPWAGLVMDAKGNLYGTTYYGGSGACDDGNGVGCGVVFKVTWTGKETVLHSFKGSPDGANPYASLVMDAEENLYGTTVYGGGARCLGNGCGTVFKVTRTTKETVLYSFGTGTTNEAWPYGGLVMDAKGNLYGTTLYGGPADAGTVFKVGKSGKETVLYSFSGGAGGGNPAAGLVMDANGNFYGTTQTGGAGCGSIGCGTVFKLTP